MSLDPVVISLQNASSCPNVPIHEQLSAWLHCALNGDLQGEVTLRIVGEAESAELNARYRHRDGPTNVLAFPGSRDHPAAGVEPRPAGDLIVCAPLLEREALEQGKTLTAHWAHIVIHGALHLLGYDHATPVQAERMEARERELLAQFEFPDPYR